MDTFTCLYDDCDYNTKRTYDLDRHYKAKHSTPEQLAERGKMYDCPDPRCGARGKHGFKRKDHLRDHVRRLHRHDLGADNKTFGSVCDPPKQRNKGSR